MNLENKIPPPIIALVIGIIISTSSAIIKPFNIYGIEFVALVIMAGSFLIIILSINKFKKENTTINPMDLTQTIKLVATGTFALSRNPMYLGLVWYFNWCYIIFKSLAWVYRNTNIHYVY